MIHRILLATDGSSYSEKAGKYALEVAEKLGVEVTALHIIEQALTKRLSPEEVERQKAVKAEESFSGVRRGAEKANVNLETLVLIAKDVAQAILKESEEGYDLIVVGNLGKTGLKKFLLGSVSEKVVRRASIPVMVVH